MVEFAKQSVIKIRREHLEGASLVATGTGARAASAGKRGNRGATCVSARAARSVAAAAATASRSHVCVMAIPACVLVWALRGRRITCRARMVDTRYFVRACACARDHTLIAEARVAVALRRWWAIVPGLIIVDLPSVILAVRQSRSRVVDRGRGQAPARNRASRRPRRRRGWRCLPVVRCRKSPRRKGVAAEDGEGQRCARRGWRCRRRKAMEWL